MIKRLQQVFGDSQQLVDGDSKIIVKEYSGRWFIYWENTSNISLKTFKKEDLRFTEYLQFFKQLEQNGYDVREKWNEVKLKHIPNASAVITRWGDGRYKMSYQKLPKEFPKEYCTIKKHYDSLYEAYLDGYNELQKMKSKSDETPKIGVDSDSEIILYLLKEVSDLKSENKELKASNEVLITGEYKRIVKCPQCGSERVIKRSNDGKREFVGCVNGKHATLPMSGLIRRMYKLGLISTWEEYVQY